MICELVRAVRASDHAFLPCTGLNSEMRYETGLASSDSTSIRVRLSAFFWRDGYLLVIHVAAVTSDRNPRRAEEELKVYLFSSPCRGATTADRP